MKLFALVFSLIGLPFLALSVVRFVDTARFVGSSEVAEGTVVEVDSRRVTATEVGTVDHPVVAFTDARGNRILFRSDTGVGWSGRPGTSIDVAYDPERPAEARVRSFRTLWLIPSILLLIGVVFGGVGLLFVALLVRKSVRKRRLIRHGNRIDAEITSIVEDGFSSTRGKHPLIVHARAVIGGRRRKFEGDPVREDPRGKIGKTVRVYVDEQNPKRYWMDVAGSVREHEGEEEQNA